MKIDPSLFVNKRKTKTDVHLDIVDLFDERINTTTELVRSNVVLTTNTFSLILIVIVLIYFTFRSVIHIHRTYIHSMAQGTLSLGGERITGTCV